MIIRILSTVSSYRSYSESRKFWGLKSDCEVYLVYIQGFLSLRTIERKTFLIEKEHLI